MTLSIKRHGETIGELVTGTWPAHGDNYVHAFWRMENGLRSVEAFDYNVMDAGNVCDSGAAVVDCPECRRTFSVWASDDVFVVAQEVPA